MGESLGQALARFLHRPRLAEDFQKQIDCTVSSLQTAGPNVNRCDRIPIFTQCDSNLARCEVNSPSTRVEGLLGDPDGQVDWGTVSSRKGHSGRAEFLEGLGKETCDCALLCAPLPMVAKNLGDNFSSTLASQLPIAKKFQKM